MHKEQEASSKAAKDQLRLVVWLEAPVWCVHEEADQQVEGKYEESDQQEQAHLA